jgi:hypothetical protein
MNAPSWWRRWRTGPERGLLHALAAQNGLSRAEARLCWRLGCQLAPELPLAMFVRPSLWEAAVATGRLERVLAAALTHRLFGGH